MYYMCTTRVHTYYSCMGYMCNTHKLSHMWHIFLYDLQGSHSTGKPGKPGILSLTFLGMENAWNLLKTGEKLEF